MSNLQVATSAKRYRKIKKKKYSQKYGSQYKMVKKIAKEVLNGKTEMKFYQTGITFGSTVGGVVMDWNGFQLDMTGGIPQGVSQNQRVGDQIRLQGLKFNYQLLSRTGIVRNNVRIVIIHQKENSITNRAQLIPGAASFLTPMAILNKDSRPLYTLLYDQWHCLESGTNDATAIVKQFIPLKGKKVEYNPGALTYISGSVIMYVWTDSATNATDPAMFLNYEFTYTDF